jgi:hypothetical protein
MSTIYAQHSVSSVSVGPTGHQHNRASKDDGHTPFALDCEVCEPFLVKEGWVYNPEQVPLTDSQIREKERVEREGNLAVKQAAEMLASAAADAVTHRTKSAKPEQDDSDEDDDEAPAKRTLTAEQKAKMAEGRRKAAAARS